MSMASQESLAQIPPGGHITVIGITDRSFAQPYILLSASVPEDPGYFGERLTAARSELIRVWRQRSTKLAPTFKGTDILGAVELASHIFSERPADGAKRELVIFSDMRNRTPELDLETSKGLAIASMHKSVHISPNLGEVDVFVLGVEAADNRNGDWQEILAYWKQLFSTSGAVVEEFSPLRRLSSVADR